MTYCRICNARVVPFLSLGRLPLGNAFLKPADFEKEQLFALTLGFCDSCSLVQSMTPPPDVVLQADYQDYRYVPIGVSLRDNLTALGREVGESGNFVVDIGSNDGTLLLGAASKGANVLGVEPAIDISEQARKAGVPTITGFFDADVAKEIVTRHGLADVVTCTQTLQHIPDPVAFVRAVRSMLCVGGRFVVEGRYFLDTVKSLTFDTIYHEMMSCFTFGSLRELLRLGDFTIERVERIPTYGGSLRVYARSWKWSGNLSSLHSSVRRIKEEEAEIDLSFYTKFAENVATTRDKLRALVFGLKADGARIVGYGAPSTSATLLGYCGIGKAIDYLVDDNSLKQGMCAPGTHLPIFSALELQRSKPDYIFLCAWQFKDAIIKRTQGLGAAYILPIPPQIIR